MMAHYPSLVLPEGHIDASDLERCDVYAVRIAAVEETPATYASPPRVELLIEERILGSSPKGSRLRAVFSGRGHTDLCGTGHADRERKRAKNPVPVPAVGSRYLVAGGWNRERTWFEVGRLGRWTSSDPRAADVRSKAKSIAKDPRKMQERAAREEESRAGGHDSALVAAAAAGDAKTVKSLLQCGARAGWSGGSPPLVRAVAAGHVDVVKLILATRSPDVLSDDHAVLRACGWNRRCDRAMLRLLLEAGVTTGNPAGTYPALHNAIARGDKEVVELLLKGGAGINEPDYNGTPPLLHATGNPAGLSLVPFLLKRGASPNCRNSSGWTPLTSVAVNARADTRVALAAVEALLKAGARVDAPKPSNWRNVPSGNPAVLDRLRKAGFLP